MQKTGVIGLGNMGSGLAKNLIKAGFETKGWDIDPAKVTAHAKMGGIASANPADLGEGTEAAFVMVMNGDQVKSVLFDDEGLTRTLAPGAAIIITATIHAHEMDEIAEALSGQGYHVIDSPVSGGRPGAQGGTLTLMAAGAPEAMAYARPALEAISGTIHPVGDTPGQGQTVKACLQSLIGSIFTATYEAAGLAAKAGVDAKALHGVVSTSAAGCGIASGSLENISAGRFKDTGSHIDTMYKDLTISMALAQRMGVPLFTASTAMQLFQAGKTRHPDGDNQVVAQLIEEIIDAELRA